MSSGNVQYVGPYRLDKTLGKGQTGLVKMGIHCVTGKKVAIKVVNREKLSENVINKVEREIAIMKLIDHPHILGLYDVYENKKYLYLILELIAGGELFDYLVKKGRLNPREARHFFRQIVSAVDFCHHHNVCHRDLKPENLLLDEKNNIKVADFGMASLQPEGYLLETSCGSPHYACPEVIRGEKYDGRTADVWSCGVILFALLVGALPFDDDNLRHLLEKVKKGNYLIPSFVQPEAQNLLRGMIEVRPDKRLSLQQVLDHQWMRVAESNGAINLDGKVGTDSLGIECPPLGKEEEADPDVLVSMSSLGCFRNHDKLLANLTSEEHNTEKVVYYMLLRRKKRHPSFDDDADSLPYKHPDAPRKRVDSTSSRSSLSSSIDDVSICETNLSTGSLSSVSGRSGRRKLSAEGLCLTERSSSLSRRGTSNVHQSDAGKDFYSKPLPHLSMYIDNRSKSLTDDSESRMRSSSSNRVVHSISPSNYKSTSSNTAYKTGGGGSKSKSHAGTTNNTGSQSPLPNVSSSNNPWRQRLNSFKNSFLGSPRFHRRKMQAPSCEDVNHTPSHMSPSMELSKRSWFVQFVTGSSSTHMSSRDRDDFPLTLVMNHQTLNGVKTELSHTFLNIANLTYTILSPARFLCEYRSHGSVGHSVFHGKVVRFHADITKVSSSVASSRDQEISRKSCYGNYHVTFLLVSGPNRRFKRVLELIQIKLAAEPFVPKSKPEAEALIVSRKLEQFCNSAANCHDDDSRHQSRYK